MGVMQWLRRLYSKGQRQVEESVFQDKMDMHLEVRKAHSDWAAAYQKLNWATERDQIDYAIYALEAAEKRYEMLLRRAKQLSWEDGILIASQAQKVHLQWYREDGQKGSKGKAAGY